METITTSLKFDPKLAVTRRHEIYAEKIKSIRDVMAEYKETKAIAETPIEWKPAMRPAEIVKGIKQTIVKREAEGRLETIKRTLPQDIMGIEKRSLEVQTGFTRVGEGFGIAIKRRGAVQLGTGEGAPDPEMETGELRDLTQDIIDAYKWGGSQYASGFYEGYFTDRNGGIPGLPPFQFPGWPQIPMPEFPDLFGGLKDIGKYAAVGIVAIVGIVLLSKVWGKKK